MAGSLLMSKQVRSLECATAQARSGSSHEGRPEEGPLWVSCEPPWWWTYLLGTTLVLNFIELILAMHSFIGPSADT